MLVFYLVAILTSGMTLMVLRRQRFKGKSFLHALIVLVGLCLVGLVFSLVLAPMPAWLVFMLQSVSWGVFLWGLSVRGRWLAGFLLVLALLYTLPVLPVLDIVSWGLVTAVPLAAALLNREQDTIPIFAPTKKSSYMPPHKIIGEISPATIQTQKPILECLDTGIIASGLDGKIQYANQGAGVIVDTDPSELAGRPVTDILTQLPMLSAAELEDAQSGSARIRKGSFELNGRIIQGRMTIVYDNTGAAQGTVAVLRDITAEFNAQQSRDNFLTTVSHELRTPLTAIKGYVELMAGGAGGELTTNQQYFIRTIQRNVTRMVQLINSLIFASAVKGGRLEFTSDRTNLVQVIQQISREKTPAAAENGQQITVQLNGRFPPIQADPIHVTIILEELIDNAIKYNKQGGEIRIQASLQADESNHNEFIIVSVKDDGVGVPADMQANIFDDFFHPDMNDTQVRAGGMGMGLSVVRSLIDAYNGRIWLESTPDKGSSFFFLLPTKQPEENKLFHTI